MSTPELFAIRRSPGDCPSRAASSRQKVMTFQCFSVSGQTPSSRAISSPTSRVHCELSRRNPSSLVSTACPAYSRVGMRISFPGSGGGDGGNGPLAGHRHAAGDRDGTARQEQVPVGPLEEELAPMVAARFFQKRQGAEERKRKD